MKRNKSDQEEQVTTRHKIPLEKNVIIKSWPLHDTNHTFTLYKQFHTRLPLQEKKYFIIQKWSLLQVMGTKEEKFLIKM